MPRKTTKQDKPPIVDPPTERRAMRNRREKQNEVPEDKPTIVDPPTERRAMRNRREKQNEVPEDKPTIVDPPTERRAMRNRREKQNEVPEDKPTIVDPPTERRAMRNRREKQNEVPEDKPTIVDPPTERRAMRNRREKQNEVPEDKPTIVDPPTERRAMRNRREKQNEDKPTIVDPPTERHVMRNRRQKHNDVPEDKPTIVDQCTERHAMRNRRQKQNGVPENPGSDLAPDGGIKQVPVVERNEATTTRDGSADVVPEGGFDEQATTETSENSDIAEGLREVHKSQESRPPESQYAAAPRGLCTRLMPHQLHALAWMQWRETQRTMGGILADDMGLGKTITTISLILADKKKAIPQGDVDEDHGDKGSADRFHGRTLVVCPASLIQQWAAEVKKHCGSALTLCEYHGAKRTTKNHLLHKCDLVLTTYNLLQKKGVLMEIKWRRIILDEAHLIRNHRSLNCAGVCSLRGSRRWGLTGTPVQNKVSDLFALMKFLRCKPFDELTVWTRLIDDKIGGPEGLCAIMRCIVLRRTKLQLQQNGQLSCLPDKHQHLVEVTLSAEEMEVYDRVYAMTLQRVEEISGAPASQKDSARAAMPIGGKPIKSPNMLVSLLRLRQICCHCGLVARSLDAADVTRQIFDDSGEEDRLADLHDLSFVPMSKDKIYQEVDEEDEEEDEDEATTVAEDISSVLSPNNPVFKMSWKSSKIKAVIKCLKENVFVNKGAKAVIVSQWKVVLTLAERQLNEERIQCFKLTGEVPLQERTLMVNKLNNPKNRVRVMLLSLFAGSLGLNLTGANHLLILDNHWNPQVEEQAQDRIYRVGQTMPVHIYRFICKNTVEQNIWKLQQAKLEIARNVLSAANSSNASQLALKDLKILFDLEPKKQ